MIDSNWLLRVVQGVSIYKYVCVHEHSRIYGQNKGNYCFAVSTQGYLLSQSDFFLSRLIGEISRKCEKFLMVHFHLLSYAAPESLDG